LTVIIFSVIFTQMKKYVCFLFLSCYALAGHADAFDLKGLQPLAPYGVFSTFSAESLQAHRLGMALGFERSKEPNFYRITGQLGYGITDSIELDITIPYTTGWHTNQDGFEDIAIGLKHRFFEEGKYGPSVAYLLTASLRSGTDDFTTKGSIGAGIIVSKKVGPVKGHLNLFYSRPGSSDFKDDITFAAGLDFAASHNLTFLSELYMKKSYSGSVDRLEARAGFRVLVTDNIYTTLGAGYDFKRRSPEYRLLMSLSYLFPSDEKKIKKIFEQED
jgi:hypothetical protein